MDIALNFTLIAAGVLCLAYGADRLVDAASKAGAKLGMSSVLIGLTIVSIGTSLPELFVSLFAASKGEAGLSIGNIVGSNIFNIGAILAVTATICPISVKKSFVKQEIPILIGLTLLFSIPLLLNLSIGVPFGVLILVLMCVFLLVLKSTNKVDASDFDFNVKEVDLSKEGISICIGGILLYIGSEGLVMGAVALAEMLGVSPTVIGLTIVAAGTGSPEIFACIACALKNQPDMALGNIIGSNLFNIFMVAGITSTFFTIPSGTLGLVDALTLIFLTIILFPIAFSKFTISRLEGCFLFLIYLGYIAVSFLLAF